MKGGKIKVYLAAPIFTERDRNYNSYLEKRILEKHPNIDLYLAQNNASINDKRGCATSADIYVGDVRRLKEADMVITIMSGDMPPIGSSYECAYYCGLCEQDNRRQLVALYDDSREGSKTYSEAKCAALKADIAESQFPYINLLAVAFVKKFGIICGDSEKLLEVVDQKLTVLEHDNEPMGIYKVTNLKTLKCFVGKSEDVYNDLNTIQSGMKPRKGMCKVVDDIVAMGKDYFRFEVIEKCGDKETLRDRYKYWAKELDSVGIHGSTLDLKGGKE